MPMEFEVRIPKATWAAGVAQNTGLDADIALPDTLRGVGGDPIRGVIGGNARNQLRSISIVSAANHAFELWFFASATRYPANRDSNKFLGRLSFVATDAVQNTADGTSSWYYSSATTEATLNDISIRDDDNSGKLHITLIDRTGALAANSDVVIELRMAPLSQFP